LTLAADAPFLNYLSSIRPEDFLRDSKAVSSFSSAPLRFRSKSRFRNIAQLAVGESFSEPMLSSGNT
jgi:hypothetical protein